MHLVATLTGVAVAVLSAVAPARAERPPLETILQDDAQLLHGDDAQVREALRTMRAYGTDRVRVTAGWSVLTRGADGRERPAFDATDPAAYEQERWRALDRAVRLAHEEGVRVMLDVAFWAPLWGSRDPEPGRARTEIDPAAFRDFAVAVARRYSGTFVPPRPPPGAPESMPPPPTRDEQFLDELFRPERAWRTSTPAPPPPDEPVAPLPRVDMITLWNEPNHPGFMKPQWQRVRGKVVPASPPIYRRMVQAAYPAVKAVRPDLTVLVGATSALGDHTGRGVDAVPPLRFIRDLACVDRRLRPRTSGACRSFERVPGDGWSHHPYSLTVPPGRPSTKPDDARIGDLGKLTRLLRTLGERGRLAPALRKVYLTEYGYETRLGSQSSRYGPRSQATFLTWAEYLAWRNPDVRTFAQFLLRDLPATTAAVRAGGRAPGHWESGLLFADGRPKPAASAFRVGLYVERLGRGLRCWGRVRGATAGGRGWVEARAPGARWRRVATRDPRTSRWSATFGVRADRVVDRRARRGRAGTRYRLVVRAGARRDASVEVFALPPGGEPPRATMAR